MKRNSRSHDRGRTTWSVVGSACIVAALCLADGRAFAGDWPQWRGPNRDGVSDEVVAPWKKFPKPAWKRPTLSAAGGAIVADGIVYIHAPVADKDEEQVVAVDLATGKDLWTDTYKRAEYRSQLGVGPRATPAVIDGKLFTTGITGVITCYEAKSGKRLWQINPWEDLNVPLPTFAVCASPVIAGDRLVVPVGGEGASVVAYDTATGKELWKTLDEPAACASPILMTRGQGEAKRVEVVAQTTLRIVGLDPKDGAVQWEHPLVFQPTGVSPTPLAMGDSLICTTQDTGTLVLKLPTGPEPAAPTLDWWKQDMASYFTSGCLDPHKGRAYIVTNQVSPLPRADVTCVDVKTGDEKWVKKGLGYFHVGLITLGDGKLLALDDAGNLMLMDPTETKLQELARASACGGTFCSPCLSRGRLVVRDANDVVCYDLSQTDQEPADAKPTETNSSEGAAK